MEGTSVWLAEHREDGGRRQKLEVEKPVKAQSPAREEGAGRSRSRGWQGPESLR